MKSIILIALVLVASSQLGFSVKCPVCEDDACKNPPLKKCGEGIQPTAPPPTATPTEPTKSSSEPTKSSSEPTKSSSEPTKSSSEPTKSSSEPTKSSSEPTKSSSEPTKSSSEPTKSSSEPTKSSSEPTKSSSEPTKSSSEPTKSSSTLTKPSNGNDENDDKNPKNNLSKKFAPLFLQQNQPLVRMARDTEDDSDEYSCLYVQYRDSADSNHTQEYCLPKAQKATICDDYKAAVGDENVFNCTLSKPQPDASDQVVQSVVVVLFLSCMAIFAF